MIEPFVSAGRQSPVKNQRGIVATVHPLATAAGIDALASGGNAIDAAIAAAVTLGVVDGHNSGLGGGCFMLIRRAGGEIVALDGRETAPAASARDMFIRGGKAEPSLSQTGALASAVPSALAAYSQALAAYGCRTLQDILSPAAQLAEEGFPIDFVYARKLVLQAGNLRLFEASRALFFKDDGAVLQEGDWLRQEDLARSYRAMGAYGPDWFYRGPYARTVAEWMQKHGGILTEADFDGYTPRRLREFSMSYRSHEIVGLPPPSSGGVHVAQILNILENFDLQAVTPGEREHLVVEAMKLAFADRAYWLGDPDFVNVPKGLLDKGYAAELAKRIDREQATPVPEHGLPPDAETRFFEKHTTHISTADAEGNWVALTATVNTAFGSKVIVPGTGILLNNEMDDFAIDAGVPNAFKLVGAEANSVAPGKRPLSSMSPTLVFRNGLPIVALGAAGGPTIISQTVRNLIAMLDLSMTPAEAVAQPRIHQQWQPDHLRVEESLPEEISEALQKRGHRFSFEPNYGASQIVARDIDGCGFTGASDPRTSGTAEIIEDFRNHDETCY